MAEIENKRPSFEVFQNPVDRAIKGAAADQERHRIEVALDWLAALQFVARKRKIDRPVKPDRIDCNGIDISPQSAAGAPWKADKLRCRYLRLHSSDDSRTRFDAAAIKFVVRQYTCPRIEYLDGIDTSLELLDQIRCRDFSEKVEQLLKQFR